ncbi:hypothetical protein ACFZCP_34160 [Streptomyces sp. NPDC007971]
MASRSPTWPSGWGHKSTEETYRTYWHLMPGNVIKETRVLDAGLWDAV